MATNTDVPEIYTALQGGQREMVQHQQLHTLLLSKVADHLEAIKQKKTPFRVTVPSIQTVGGSANGAPAATGLSAPLPMTGARGEILTVQNPTAASLTVDVRERNGATVLKVTVAAGDYKALFVPFFEQLFVFGGAGMILSGNVYE